ncbi:MAG TPA: hypothetical protein DCW46_04885 [Desulfotomaculum sp.]|nr:hypothetical protein [Desulfotomaculum sp.]
MVINATYVKNTLIPDTKLEYNLYPKKKQLNQKIFKQKRLVSFQAALIRLLVLKGGFKPRQRIKA